MKFLVNHILQRAREITGLKALPSARRRRPVGSIVWAMLCLVSCIDRNNPFDPINFSLSQTTPIKNAQSGFLDSLSALADSTTKTLAPLQADFNSIQSLNDSISQSNDLKKTANSQTAAGNAAVTQANQSAGPADSLKLEGYYDTLNYLLLAGPYPSVNFNMQQLSLLQATALARVDSVNRALLPMVVYSDSERAQIQAPYLQDLNAYTQFQNQVNTANQTATNTNSSIAAYNLQQISLNAAVQSFNLSVVFHNQSLGKILVTTADSLHKYISAAKPGDTIFVGAGDYAGQILFQQSGTVDSPIVIQGDPGAPTILSASPQTPILFLSDFSYIEFHDVVFQQSGNSGAKLENGCTGILFETCDFLHNALDGLEIVDSYVKVKNCRFLQNERNGIQVSGATSQIVLDNVLVAYNVAAGINATSANGSIQGLTVSDNGVDGIEIRSPTGPLRISNSIIAFNGSYGLNLTLDMIQSGALQLEDLDFYANDSGLINLPQSDWPLTPIQVDPAFVSRDTLQGLNYSILPTGDLSTLQNQGVVIGYRNP